MQTVQRRNAANRRAYPQDNRNIPGTLQVGQCGASEL